MDNNGAVHPAGAGQPYGNPAMPQYDPQQQQQYMQPTQQQFYAHHQQQQQQMPTMFYAQGQYLTPQTMVLQGKPLEPGQVPPQGHAYQHGAPVPLVALPGGTYIQPQFGMASGGQAVAGGGSAGYPQLAAFPGGHYAMMQQAPAGGGYSMAGTTAPQLAVQVKQESGEERPSSSHSANTSAGGLGSDGSPQVGGSGTPSAGNKSRYRGVSYDRKKAKWRVQIKVAALGKSGVSVGYFDTEEAAARAYDRAAIGLLGRDNPNLQTNFELTDYAEEPIPRLTGKTREEVKTTLKSERIKQAPRRRFTSRQRTSRFMGVGSSNRKNQWQARILVHGKVTHLGYYETEEDAARVYDRVSLALHGSHAQTNFATADYRDEDVAPYRGLDREDLQRALGVKPMDKSSRFRGVSKKKGKWEAKVMVNRRWAYRELFDSEEEAARAYDRALWRLKPREARSYVNFKDEVPADAEAMAAAAAAGGGAGGVDFRGAVSDGDIADSVAGDDDDGSDGGDFEYEYRPTKGTTRSTSMRAKRSGSMPNLAASTAAAATAAATAATVAVKPEPMAMDAGPCCVTASPMPLSGPSFVPIPGGGLQLNFGGGGGASGAEEPLLIRVGSETHVLPHHGHAPVSQILGKRTGLQRIQSEPRFMAASQAAAAAAAAASHEAELLQVPGADACDIHDLMNDRDLFRGLDLAELAAVPGVGPSPMHMQMQMQGGSSGGTGGGAIDLNGFSLDFLQPDHDRRGDNELGGLLFEDEDLLANLEFSRPKKMSKSMSTSQLPLLAASLHDYSPEPELKPMPHAVAGQRADPRGRPPLPPSSRRSPEAANSGGSGDDQSQLGALGQPVRRVNPFTSSLPSFLEGEEKVGVHHADDSRAASGGFTQHSSEEDLVNQFLQQPMHQMTTTVMLDDPLHVLDDDS